VAYRDSSLARINGASEQGGVDRAVQEALRSRCVRLASQPVVALTEAGSIGWVELLLRPHDRGVALPTDVFVDRAAALGQARALDLLVLETGLSWLAQEHAVALCSINVSGQSVSDPGFLEGVRDRIDDSGVDPARLCFEITETAPIADFPAARSFARTLRSIGCRIALDDFGTGSSNMLMLAPLEMDFLKIDGSFIRHLPQRRDHARLVEGIVKFAETVGLQTVAECVETEGQHDCLAGMGVGFIQGYYKEGAPRIVDPESVQPALGKTDGGWRRGITESEPKEIKAK
jgi:EAL domain-containing protein (putative c-di-GMP-specific phosphodiesterase class I)